MFGRGLPGIENTMNIGASSIPGDIDSSIGTTSLQQSCCLELYTVRTLNELIMEVAPRHVTMPGSHVTIIFRECHDMFVRAPPWRSWCPTQQSLKTIPVGYPNLRVSSDHPTTFDLLGPFSTRSFVHHRPGPVERPQVWSSCPTWRSSRLWASTT